jgi:hypothetical protein
MIRNQRMWIGVLALWLAGFALYGHSLNNEFLFDDELQVVGNPIVHSLQHIPQFFLGSTYANGNSSVAAGIYFKPLTVLSYALLWRVSPEDALGFHLAQLSLAILNAILVFFLLSHFMPGVFAWLAALIFLVHPINSEVIAYIGDLQDVLYMFFGLLTLLLLVADTHWKPLKAAAFSLLLLLSLLSKESGLLFICVAGVYTAFYRREQWIRISLCALIPLGIYAFLRLNIAHMSTLVYRANQIGRADFATRLVTAPKVLFNYLFNFIAPIHFTTTQDWVISTLNGLDFWFPLFALLMLSAGLFFGVRRYGKDFAYFALWLVGGLFFHSHILVPLDGTFSDRWFYFPSIALLALVGLVAAQTIKPQVALVLGVIVALALSVRSFYRAEDWADGFTLAQHDVQLLPDSYSLLNNLGTELFRRGQIAEAKVQFERSISAKPDWDINWNNLGAVEYRQGDLKAAEQHYLRAIQNGPNLLAYENYAGLLAEEGRLLEAQKFIESQVIAAHLGSDRLTQIYQYVRGK